MPHERLQPEFNKKEAVGVDENIEEIKRLFPEALADGKINFDTLKELLSGKLEEGDEHFGLFWPGKREARKLAMMPSKGTLGPCPGEGINEENTGNIFIEGENLEVLKILQKSYAGRIKMIYIDPPYNTGNDFVYDDNFTEPLEDYLKRTGQIDGEGRPLTTNTKADGRFHSKWLSMMYPRLKLAKNLLREDGVLFVSIDNNEIHHLKIILNEIYGEENYIADIVWEKVHTRKNSSKYFSYSHEYILAVAKNIEQWKRILIPRSDFSAYSNPDNDPKGDWKPDPITAHNPYSADYKITKPNGVILSRPKDRYWAFSEESWNKKVENNEVLWGEGNSYPMIKRYLSEVQDGLVPITIFKRDFASDSSNSRREITKILGNAYFEYTKPSQLIKRLLQISSDGQDDIILDFFGGTATTAHAVYEMNIEDGKNRQYIIVQMTELLDEKSEAFKAGYKSIAEIGKERIRRVCTSLTEELKNNKKKNNENLPGISNSNATPDLGFKVYKLTHSNFKEWHDQGVKELKTIQRSFDDFEETLVEGWNHENLLAEIILTEGFPLDCTIASISAKNNKIVLVTTGSVSFRLFVCLDKTIKQDDVESFNLTLETHFICLDAALDDTLKMQLADRCILKTI